MYLRIRNLDFREDICRNNIDKSMILPSSYTKNSRYMFEYYHDIITIYKFYGHSDLFITFTYNLNRIEIKHILKYDFVPNTLR